MLVFAITVSSQSAVLFELFAVLLLCSHQYAVKLHT